MAPQESKGASRLVHAGPLVGLPGFDLASATCEVPPATSGRPYDRAPVDRGLWYF